MNTFGYVYQNPLRYKDPEGLDVWTEGAVEGEGGLGFHQSICVETKGMVVLPQFRTSRYCISFGVSKPEGFCIKEDCEGQVYVDSSLPGAIKRYMSTTPIQDKKVRERFESMVGRSGPYNLLSFNCRDFVDRLFNDLKGSLKSDSK